MLIVPRQITELENDDGRSEPRPLSDYREHPAWVLLGEPGAGKSTALKEEAEAVGGCHLRIAKFIHVDDVSPWAGKDLFLDGLDEVRAGQDGTSVLIKACERLERLKYPRFRIACRAADWYGSSDRAEITSASPDRKLAVLRLEPLTHDQIGEILRENHEISDPATFVGKARDNGVAELLENPQTLELLAQAIYNEHWPSSRDETFDLATRKLVEEINPNRQRTSRTSADQRLEAAKHLCAAMLLSDKDGVALDLARATHRYPWIEDYGADDTAAATAAVGSRLFHPEHEERFEPAHRSVAEYLAGRWLAERIDRQGLPVGRVLNLLLGVDGRTVAGLRGLYAWLAVHSRKARRRMIDADPMTVVLYGDAKPLPAEDKRRILTGLRREAESHTDFRRDASRDQPLGALADSALTDDFTSALETPDRGDAAQAFAGCVLDILAKGEPLPVLSDVLKRVIADPTWWDGVRRYAMRAWLALPPPAGEAIALLDDIRDDRVSDSDDELAGLLLQHLYPNHIAPERLLRYLHVVKDPHLLGHYAWFWTKDVPERAPDDHLPTILDQLALRTDLPFFDPYELRLDRVACHLLARGVEAHGETMAVERLWSWFGMGFTEHHEPRWDDAARQRVAAWLRAHPDVHKHMLALCFQRCADHENPDGCLYRNLRRIEDFAPPDDIGRWHLDQASTMPNAALARFHLSEAIATLRRRQGDRGLSLEDLESWAREHPDRNEWLRPMLVSEISDRQLKRAAKKLEQTQSETVEKQERSRRVMEQIDAIRDGTAGVGLLHEIALVWRGYMYGTNGETPRERFTRYYEDGGDIWAAAKVGLHRQPERDDLPAVAEVIELNLQKRQHYVCQPCLIGMELRWQHGQSAIEVLSENALSIMVAFHLTHGMQDSPGWYRHLVLHRPPLVARVLVEYVGKTLKSKQDYITGTHALEHDDNYRAVAEMAVPELLRTFPPKAPSDRLRHLKHLLMAARRYRMPKLAALIEDKTARRNMDAAQKVYWLAMGMLTDPARYETALWRYVGYSAVRVNHLSTFLHDFFTDTPAAADLSTTTIGRLIELLAPDAVLDWTGGGAVTDAMRRGDHVRSLIDRLGMGGSEEAEREIERLLDIPALNDLRFALQSARNQSRLSRRERAFRFLAPAEVAQVLSNREPASVADLAALALDHLDDIAVEIRRENDDGFRKFWDNVGPKDKNPVRRHENLCRDELLYRFRAHLGPHGVDCQPEKDHSNDKQADIQLSFRNQFEIPIEIKCDDNKSLWTALRDQLIAQYTMAPHAEDHGIYIVLWFGGKGMPSPTDGEARPTSPAALRERLEAQLDPAERHRVFVRVLDVSLP